LRDVAGLASARLHGRAHESRGHSL
jgi:hypothetical protein